MQKVSDPSQKIAVGGETSSTIVSSGVLVTAGSVEYNIIDVCRASSFAQFDFSVS